MFILQWFCNRSNSQRCSKTSGNGEDAMDRRKIDRCTRSESVNGKLHEGVVASAAAGGEVAQSSLILVSPC